MAEDKEVVVEAEKLQQSDKAVKKKKNNASRIKELEEEIARLKNEYARAYADTENMRKRLQNEHEQLLKYRAQSFVIEILPVLDNLERALAQEVNEEASNFKKGIEMTYQELKAALEKEGVHEVECLNQNFDPNTMQALTSEKNEEFESGKVIEVFQKGYLLKDRILRAAMVKVAE